MSVVIVTGAGGLVGSEAVRFFAEQGLSIVGIENDMRRSFFGEGSSTKWNLDRLREEIPSLVHYDDDVRNESAMGAIFRRYGKRIAAVIHTAAQPSHDWAAKEPFVDFSVNALGTLVLLEAVRKECPDAVFIFTSTNKVYGDRPNSLPLTELETRWELEEPHPYAAGIDETMNVDATKHSLFGVSKLAADMLVQEYGRYFGMKTGVFRGGCLTGPAHSGTELHGFLSYLMKCAVTGSEYVIYGYKGKQVRDNIHSRDLVEMFWHYFREPRVGEVYNVGGSRHCNCSVLEAMKMCEEFTGKPMRVRYTDTNRSGDHVWWISDVRKFRGHYPNWDYTKDMGVIMEEIYDGCERRFGRGERCP